GPTVCLRMNSADALTMIADNVPLAQGLFRMLLTGVVGHTDGPQCAPGLSRSIPVRSSGSLDAVEKALRLRQNPWLARATVPQLLDLVEIAREGPLTNRPVLLGAPAQ